MKNNLYGPIHQHADCATYQFENDPALPASAASPIGVYQGVLWKGISLAKSDDSTGLTPNSFPNFASLQGTPQITTVFDGSIFTALTLNSFFFGCAVDAEAPFFSTAVSCSVTLKGFSAAGDQVATGTFSFFATGFEQPMIQVQPNGFNFVQYITFEFEVEFGATALIDTVAYDVFSAL